MHCQSSLNAESKLSKDLQQVHISCARRPNENRNDETDPTNRRTIIAGHMPSVAPYILSLMTGPTACRRFA